MDYQLLWLGDEQDGLPAHAQAKSLRDVPSLMYLCELPAEPPRAVVLDFRQGCPYSTPHVLSAAKLLSAGPHRLFVLPGRETFPGGGGLTFLPEDVEAALAMIDECMSRPEDASGGGKEPKPEPPPPKPPRPALELYGTILILAVAGSQSRMGCTTQAFALWHYCKSLGLQPAVVMPPDAAAVLAKFMDGRSRDGGFVIGEIPVVDGMTYEFDCYVQDLGVLTPDKQKRFQDADCGLLVMGGKPWELTFAAKALPLTQGQKRLGLLVSFCTEAALEELRQIFPDRLLAAADWRPDPFQPQPPDFDELLLPLLEQAVLPNFSFEP